MRLSAKRRLRFRHYPCVQLESDSQYTLVDGGHLAPYISGQELDTLLLCRWALAHEEYEPISGPLLEAKKMLLLSDGALEGQ